MIPYTPDSILGSTEDTDVPRYPSLLQFRNVVHASHISLYNGAVALLLKIFQDLVGSLDFLESIDRGAPPGMPQPAKASALLLPPEISSLSDVTDELLRSVDFQIDCGRSIAVDSFRLICPFFLASGGMQADSASAKLIRKLVEKISSRSGIHFLNHN